MRKQDSAEHDLFRKLLGFGFDHHHRVISRRDNQIEFAFGNLFVGRIEDIFAVQIADACCADRAHEGHARKRERSGRRDHREDIRLILSIIGEDLSDGVDLVVEALWKQRANGTVDKTRNQSFLFGRAAFAFEKATGNTSRSRIFFLIVNGQREEILPFLHRFGGRDSAQHNGFAERCNDSAIGLAGNLARFECQGLSAPLDCYSFRVEHLFSFGPAALCVLASFCVRSRIWRLHHPIAELREDGSFLVLLRKQEPSPIAGMDWIPDRVRDDAKRKRPPKRGPSDCVTCEDQASR